MSGSETYADGSADLAGAVFAARRARDLSVRDLTDSGLDGGVVTRLERGDAVPPAQARPVLDALGIDPVPHLPCLPPGLLPVRPLDDDHARVMAYVSGVADVRDGWLAFPDAAGMPPVPGHDPDALAQVTAASEAWRRRSIGAGTPLFVTALGLLAMGGASIVGVILLDAVFGAKLLQPGDARGGWWFLGWAGAILASLIAALLVDHRAERAVDPHAEERARLQALSGSFGRREASRLALSRRAFAVSDGGVVAYEAGDGGLVRREYLTGSFRSVRVADEDADHVRITVDTILGEVEMPWIPRSRDLLDVVARWPSQAARLEGPQ